MPTVAIKVDQVGYLTGAPKVALVAAESPAGDFTVRRAAGGAVVFRGKLSAQAADADTGDKVQAADFSAFKTNGKYYLDVPGVGRSWEFSIGPDVYSRAFYLAMRAYLRAALRHRRGPGARFPGLQARRLSPGGRVACLIGEDRPAPFGQGLA